MRKLQPVRIHNNLLKSIINQIAVPVRKVSSYSCRNIPGFAQGGQMRTAAFFQLTAPQA